MPSITPIVNNRQQITYMQVRLTRMAAERWHLSLADAARLFAENHVYEYVRDGFGVFHVQGDIANLDDIDMYLHGRGVQP